MLHIDKIYIEAINRILWDFLWMGKRIPISRNICMLPRNQGGLGLVDIGTIVKVKRVIWVIRTLEENTTQN